MDYFWKKKTIVSFVLALFVVLLHNSTIGQYVLQLEVSDAYYNFLIFTNNFLTNTFVRVAVPLFFMLSGMIFFRNYKSEMYLDKLKSRIKSLVIPFLIWNIIGMFFEIFCAYTPIHNYFAVRERFLVSAKNIFDAIFLYKCNPVFWFIFMLIIFVILTPLFDLFTATKKTAFVFTIFVLILPNILGKIFHGIPTNPNVVEFNTIGAGSAIFYTVGVVIGKYYLEDFTRKKDPKTIYVSICSCLFCIIFQILNSYNILPLPAFIYQVLLYLLCISFWNVMDLFIDKIEIRNFMKASFFIYAIHLNAEAVIVKLLYLIGPKKTWMAIPNFILSYVLTVALVLLVIRLFERFLPKIYYILTGAR